MTASTHSRAIWFFIVTWLLAFLGAVALTLFTGPSRADTACLNDAATIDDVLRESDAIEASGKSGRILLKMRSAEGMTVLYGMPEKGLAAVFVFEGKCLVSMDAKLSPDRIAKMVFGARDRAALFAPQKDL